VEWFFKPHCDTILCDALTGEEKPLSEILNQNLPMPDSRQLVLVWMQNTFKDVCTYIRLLNSDHVLMLMHGDLSCDIKSKTEERYCPDYIYDTTRDAISGYDALAQANFFIQKAVGQASSAKNLDDLSSHRKLNPNLKLLLSTSGSTGSPKMVRLSAKNLEANASSIAQVLPVAKEDCVPLNLPLSYAYGLSLLHANIGRVQKILCNFPSVLSKEFVEVMEKHQVSTLAGVPFVYQMLWRSGFAEKIWSHLRYMTQAGGHLPAVLKQKVIDFAKQQGVEFYVMYGQTEATARMSILPWKHLSAEMIDSIGVPIPDGAFSLDEESGELLYSGPNVFGGYAETPEDLAEWKDLGSLRTGDLGRCGANGFWFVEGRLKRMTKLFGERVQLDYVEKLMQEQTAVTPIVCKEAGENKIDVFSEKKLPEQEIKAFLKEKLKLRSSVFHFRQVQEIPMNSRGKVDYSRL